MRFVSRSDVARRLEGRSVAIVGSGPGALKNPAGLVDSHDVVVRVNNYRIANKSTGKRCDVFYSFFGVSIRKTPQELRRDGVKLCMAKCPNAHAIQSEWHVRHRMMNGVDFRWIYQRRKRWWFCDTYVPEKEDFLSTFYLLGKHIPTTGFSAIIDVLSCAPRSVHLTGFDFFRSKIHNLNERWKPANRHDPIGHDPEREVKWLAANMDSYPITCDAALSAVLATVWPKAAHSGLSRTTAAAT